MSDIKMQRVEEPFDDSHGPGSFKIVREGENERRTFCMFVCPNGRMCGVYVKPTTAHQRVLVWDWDGNEDAPTLSPSIHCGPNGAPGCGWHGFIQQGVMKTV